MNVFLYSLHYIDILMCAIWPSHGLFFNFNYVIFFAFQIFFINLQQTIYDKIKPIMASINESKQ